MEINNLVNFLKDFINDHADYGDHIVGILSDNLQQNFADLFVKYKHSSSEWKVAGIINEVVGKRMGW